VITNKSLNDKSLGYLYTNKNRKARSPDMIGKITLCVETLKGISEELQKRRADAVDCQIAAWSNRDKRGQQYLTIQLSLPYVRPEPKPEPKQAFDLSDFLADDPKDGQ
jgi:hypothetical protein